MTKPQRDPVVDRLRHDVDDLYELCDDSNRTAHTALAAVRGVDLRLRRFQNTSGRQFGVLIATLRQHGQRLDSMDQRLDRMDQRFDGIDRRLDGMDQRFDGIDRRFEGIDQRFEGIEGQLRHLSQTLSEVVTLLKKR